MLTRQQEAGEFDFACLKEYGPTWRIGGPLGVRWTSQFLLFQSLTSYDFPDRRGHDGGSKGQHTRFSLLIGCTRIMARVHKALQHILHKSGYNYPKRRDMSKISEIFAGGPGITAVAGEQAQWSTLYHAQYARSKAWYTSVSARS